VVLFIFFVYNAGILALDQLVLARGGYSKYIRYTAGGLGVILPWPLVSHVLFTSHCVVALE
jgi:hypothetical protein